MPRAPRILVEGGLYHVYNRFARGEEVFSDPQEAIEFLAVNSPQPPNNIENEVDRYIGWPGQALAYKIGQREIFHLRGEARERLGDRFDIREFHDVVLGSGQVPLPVLRRLVEDWIAATSV